MEVGERGRTARQVVGHLPRPRSTPAVGERCRSTAEPQAEVEIAIELAHPIGRNDDDAPSGRPWAAFGLQLPDAGPRMLQGRVGNPDGSTSAFDTRARVPETFLEHGHRLIHGGIKDVLSIARKSKGTANSDAPTGDGDDDRACRLAFARLRPANAGDPDRDLGVEQSRSPVGHLAGTALSDNRTRGNPEQTELHQFVVRDDRAPLLASGDLEQA